MTNRQCRLVLNCILVGSFLCGALVGCDEPSASPAPRPVKLRPPQPPGPPRPEPAGGEPAPSAAPAQPDANSTLTAPAWAQPQVQELVKLSAGVALPQSLPTGTAMGMSADYVRLGDLPTSAVQTFWVIEAAQGAAAAVPVQLEAQGNLMVFLTDMRPEHGPFSGYLAVVLADGTRVPISEKIDLRSP